MTRWGASGSGKTRCRVWRNLFSRRGVTPKGSSDRVPALRQSEATAAAPRLRRLVLQEGRNIDVVVRDLERRTLAVVHHGRPACLRARARRGLLVEARRV